MSPIECLEEMSEGEYPEGRDLQDIRMSLNDDLVVESTTLKEAKLLPERKLWLDGARQEIKKLEKRKCWKAVKKPKHRKLVKSKFVFKLKRDHLGGWLRRDSPRGRS
jgi:hypothetical protein